MNIQDNSELRKKNISYLDKELAESLYRSPGLGKEYTLETSKSGSSTLIVDGVYLHSKHDPKKEADRLSQELPGDDQERVYLFLGAGLGYIIQSSLQKSDKLSGVWLEEDPNVLKLALETLDFSEYLESGRLRILLSPITEEKLYQNFRGKATVPVSFVPHRGSLQWREKEYNKLRFIAEGFFRKKDVNIATLVRFEKIWTKNMIQNVTETIRLQPVSKLFGLGEGIPILVVGAGPSLANSLEEIRHYRDCFLLIAVDTALNILFQSGIDSDLVYTVDPQALNRVYLEGYKGSAKLVLDPTSTYLSPRLDPEFWKGFFTTSPFPLTKIFEKNSKEEIGNIPFGGSVSTNAYSLAKLMGGAPIYLVGQDLAFSYGHAHAKGAVLEERLNWMESRRFRRELHNHRQLTALPKLYEESLGDSPRKTRTNEKLVIFRNWFRENARDAVNLTLSGLKIEGIRESSFAEEFTELNENENQKEIIRGLRQNIQDLANSEAKWTDPRLLEESLRSLSKEIQGYLKLVEEGAILSGEIYQEIAGGRENPHYLRPRLRRMDEIDDLVSSHAHLGEILSTSMQRVIYSVTEEYDSNTTPEEKENPRLGVAKKSLLLYEGLRDQSRDLKKQLDRTMVRLFC